MKHFSYFLYRFTLLLLYYGSVGFTENLLYNRLFFCRGVDVDSYHFKFNLKIFWLKLRLSKPFSIEKEPAPTFKMLLVVIL